MDEVWDEEKDQLKEKYCNNEYEESDHGKYEAANKYVEDSCHMGKAQLALCRRLLLLLALRSVVPPSGDQAFDFVLQLMSFTYSLALLNLHFQWGWGRQCWWCHSSRYPWLWQFRNPLRLGSSPPISNLILLNYNVCACLDCVTGHPLVLVLVSRGLNEESVFSLRCPHSLNSVLKGEQVELGILNGVKIGFSQWNDWRWNTQSTSGEKWWLLP